MDPRGEYTRVGGEVEEKSPYGFRHVLILVAVLIFGLFGWMFIPMKSLPPLHTKAVAVLQGGGRVQGVIYFEQSKNGQGPVKVYGSIKGLDSDALRGFHIHEGGDLTNGCLSTGAHYNPDGRTHGAPSDTIRHVGDLGNIKSDGSGVANVAIVDKLLTLNGPRSIIGRSIVVHDGTDDLGRGTFADSPTTGHAGGRAACGIIGLTPK